MTVQVWVQEWWVCSQHCGHGQVVLANLVEKWVSRWRSAMGHESVTRGREVGIGSGSVVWGAAKGGYPPRLSYTVGWAGRAGPAQVQGARRRPAACTLGWQLWSLLPEVGHMQPVWHETSQRGLARVSHMQPDRGWWAGVTRPALCVWRRGGPREVVRGRGRAAWHQGMASTTLGTDGKARQATLTTPARTPQPANRPRVLLLLKQEEKLVSEWQHKRHAIRH